MQGFFRLILIETTQFYQGQLECIGFIFLMNHFILFETVAMITEVVSFPSSIATIVMETDYFIIMQLINPSYPWKNRVRQMKINQEKLSQSCIFYPIAKNPHLSNRVKIQQKLLSWFFTDICDKTEWIWFV